jgi:hypothetical protein
MNRRRDRSAALPVYLTASVKKVDNRRLNRLDLADWIVSRDNPTHGAGMHNRLWKQFFGVGLYGARRFWSAR